MSERIKEEGKGRDSMVGERMTENDTREGVEAELVEGAGKG